MTRRQPPGPRARDTGVMRSFRHGVARGATFFFGIHDAGPRLATSGAGLVLAAVTLLVVGFDVRTWTLASRLVVLVVAGLLWACSAFFGTRTRGAPVKPGDHRVFLRRALRAAAGYLAIAIFASMLAYLRLRSD